MESDRDRLRQKAVDLFLDLEESPDDPAALAARDAFLARGVAARQAWESVLRTWSSAQPVPVRRHRALPAAIALAATALAGLILGPDALDRYKADHLTGTEGPELVTLVSGDVVHLDAGSAIATHVTEHTREIVLLHGAAHFHTVADERAFVVETDSVRARAIGTAFAVEHSGDGVVVAVAEGAVEVAHVTGLYTVGAGEHMRIFDNGDVSSRSVDPKAVAAWREGEIVLTDASLETLVAAVDRRLAGRVVILSSRLAQTRVTGVFSLADPLATLRLAARLRGASVIAAGPLGTFILPGLLD